MKNVRLAFNIMEECVKPSVGYQCIPFHMIFDVTMDFTRKAQFVAGGHMMEAPTSLTYSSVVSRESVRIAFLLAALNDLEIVAADIGNAYLNAPCCECVYTKCGKEFGSDEGKYAIIMQALYGLKSSGAAWHAHFAETLTDLSFEPSLADPDVWIRPQTKPDGTPYYEYLLVYVDD
jgi:Reverse transcriptase (RNA-dependent DNA polymerase)